MQIAVLYGTETGNAEMLAEDIAAHLGDHDTSVTNLSDFAPADFRQDVLHVIVCSTYGDGELPASAQPFGARMQAEKPDLKGIHFAVFGMGDSEYPDTFNGGGQRIEAMLTAAGAVLIGERVTHDASGSDMADDLALPWVDGIIAQAQILLDKAA